MMADLHLQIENGVLASLSGRYKLSVQKVNNIFADVRQLMLYMFFLPTNQRDASAGGWQFGGF